MKQQNEIYQDLIERLDSLELNPETLLFLYGHYEALYTYDCISESQWYDMRNRLNIDPDILEKINY